MKKLSVILSAMALVAMALQSGFAQEHKKADDRSRQMITSDHAGMGGHGRRDGHGGRFDADRHHAFGLKQIMAMADQLELNDDQRKKLREIQYQFETEKIDLHAAAKKAKLKTKKLMADEASESEVMTAIDEAAMAGANLKKLKYRHRRQVKGLLTAEQIEKMKEIGHDRKLIRKERKEKREHDRFKLRKRRFGG